MLRVIILFFVSVSLLACGNMPPLAPCAIEASAHQPEHALKCYLARPEPQKLSFLNAEKSSEVKIYRYSLTSQVWPTPEDSAASSLWTHQLTLYVPPQIREHQVFLVVGGGTRRSLNGGAPSPSNLTLDYPALAKSTAAIVVLLEDIPNQYLSFEDHIARREDSIVAYTWNRYLDNPKGGGYWPVYLPMTKAIVKAMDAVQHIAEQRALTKNKVDQFVLVGLSKRAWAAWLTATADNRVAGLIPIVGETPNMQRLISHIHDSYEGNWPPAFQDYVSQGVVKRIHEPVFAQLMRITDPLLYLRDANVKRRLSIPKYIVSASGDDFFTPDAARLFWDQLPGIKLLRVLPNQSHYVEPDTVQASIQMYHQFSKYGWDKLPMLTEKTKQTGLYQVVLSKQPETITLWRAHNPVKRDFRLHAGIKYVATPLNGTCSPSGCVYSVPAVAQRKGWVASFVEAQFKGKKGEQAFKLTTPVYITPDQYANGKPTPFFTK
jgi:PhoPQ-activated pathogenicity-related protein